MFISDLSSAHFSFNFPICFNDNYWLGCRRMVGWTHLIMPWIMSLVILFAKFSFYTFADDLLGTINMWQKSRQWYESDINGADIETAKKRIIQRSSRLGKICVPANNYETPVLIRYARKPATTVRNSKIDKFFFIYSVDYLDEEKYRNILSSSKANIKALFKPFSPTIFTNKNQRNSPVGRCCVLIILAESVSPYVIEKASKCIMKKHEGCTVPCVIDLSVERYYFDSLKLHFEIGAEERPFKNHCISMIKQSVFGGKLPLKNNDRMLEKNFDSDFLEMTLWEFMRREKSFDKEADKEIEETANKLEDNEVFLEEENLVYYKFNNKIICFLVLLDEENSKKLNVVLDNKYEIPRKEKISVSDMNNIKDRIKDELTAKGYEIIFNNEFLPKSYRK